LVLVSRSPGYQLKKLGTDLNLESYHYTNKLSVTSQKPKKIESQKESKETSDDVYSVYEESLAKYFSEVKENAANYLQAVSDLQQEIIESRKKNTEHAIYLQKAAADKLGVNSNIPDNTFDLARSFAEQATKSWNLQNQMVLTSLDTLSKNIEAFNKNSKSFEEINKKLIDSWASTIKQYSKD